MKTLEVKVGSEILTVKYSVSKAEPKEKYETYFNPPDIDIVEILWDGKDVCKLLENIGVDWKVIDEAIYKNEEAQ